MEAELIVRKEDLKRKRREEREEEKQAEKRRKLEQLFEIPLEEGDTLQDGVVLVRLAKLAPIVDNTRPATAPATPCAPAVQAPAVEAAEAPAAEAEEAPAVEPLSRPYPENPPTPEET